MKRSPKSALQMAVQCNCRLHYTSCSIRGCAIIVMMIGTLADFFGQVCPWRQTAFSHLNWRLSGTIFFSTVGLTEKVDPQTLFSWCSSHYDKQCPAMDDIPFPSESVGSSRLSFLICSEAPDNSLFSFCF